MKFECAVQDRNLWIWRTSSDDTQGPHCQPHRSRQQPYWREHPDKLWTSARTTALRYFPMTVREEKLHCNATSFGRSLLS